MLAQLDWGVKAILLPIATEVLAVWYALLAPPQQMSTSIHGLGASCHATAALVTCGASSMQVQGLLSCCWCCCPCLTAWLHDEADDRVSPQLPAYRRDAMHGFQWSCGPHSSLQHTSMGSNAVKAWKHRWWLAACPGGSLWQGR